MPAVTRDLPPPVALVATTAAIANIAPIPTPPRKRGALRVLQLTKSLLRYVRSSCGTAASLQRRRAYAVLWLSSRRGAHQLRRSRVADRPGARRGDGALAALRDAATGDAVDSLARPGRRKGVLTRLEPDLPRGDRRASAEGALPCLR